AEQDADALSKFDRAFARLETAAGAAATDEPLPPSASVSENATAPTTPTFALPSAREASPLADFDAGDYAVSAQLDEPDLGGGGFAIGMSDAHDLDELLGSDSRDDAETHSTDSGDVSGEDPFAQYDITPKLPEIKVRSPAAPASGATIWTGRLFMPDVADLRCSAEQIAGETRLDARAWEDLLPAALSIDGRIPVVRTAEYLRQQLSSSSKQLLAVRFSSADARDAAHLHSLWTYFHTRERYGVVGYTLPSVKDMYIVPLPASRSMPEFIASLPNDFANAPPDRDMLLGIIVWNRPRSAPASSSSSSSSAIVAGRSASVPNPRKAARLAVPTRAESDAPTSLPSPAPPPLASLASSSPAPSVPAIDPAVTQLLAQLSGGPASSAPLPAPPAATASLTSTGLAPELLQALQGLLGAQQPGSAGPTALNTVAGAGSSARSGTSSYTDRYTQPTTNTSDHQLPVPRTRTWDLDGDTRDRYDDPYASGPSAHRHSRDQLPQPQQQQQHYGDAHQYSSSQSQQSQQPYQSAWSRGPEREAYYPPDARHRRNAYGRSDEDQYVNDYNQGHAHRTSAHGQPHARPFRSNYRGSPRSHRGRPYYRP
ncbi:hypothetical protein THASP1DRAFT_31556, partial [Thamnocephalis sphaerospora]